MTRRRAIPVLILGASCLLAWPGSANAWGIRVFHHHRAYGYPIMTAPGYGYSYAADPYGLSPLDWAKVGFDLLERLQQFRGGGGFRPPGGGMDPRITEIDATKIKVSPVVVQKISSLETRLSELAAKVDRINPDLLKEKGQLGGKKVSPTPFEP